MKTVGIIGGLSPQSTISYYQGLNHGACTRLGEHHNARIILNSLDFGQFVQLKQRGDWQRQAELLCEAAQSLEKAGADFIILATNTMHKMADQIIESVRIPFLHLADATAEKIINSGRNKILLLGTRYTMEQDFYIKRLENRGIEVLVPHGEALEDVNRIIYDELCHGVIEPVSKARYIQIVNDFEDHGIEGIILGCTEIGLLIDQSDFKIACFDTTKIHIEATLNYMFEE